MHRQPCPQPNIHVVEIGCGYGSSLIPVLRANPSARVTACDVSATAVRLFQQHAADIGASGRVHAFVQDGTDAGIVSVHGMQADVALLVFTLSAVEPHDMHTMLHVCSLCVVIAATTHGAQACWQALRPGGLLLLRDYGLYDMPQLRFTAAAQRGECW